MRATASWIVAISCCAAACSGRVAVTAPAPVPQRVSLEVEVYDPATNRVWRGLAVRVCAATLEWSGTRVLNPVPDDWSYTDAFGTVLFDARDLAVAEVGFVEDAFGNALLEPEPDADDAVVTLELTAPGLPSVFADVPLSWDEPTVFVSVPF